MTDSYLSSDSNFHSMLGMSSLEAFLLLIGVQMWCDCNHISTGFFKLSGGRRSKRGRRLFSLWRAWNPGNSGSSYQAAPGQTGVATPWEFIHSTCSHGEISSQILLDIASSLLDGLEREESKRNYHLLHLFPLIKVRILSAIRAAQRRQCFQI